MAISEHETGSQTAVISTEHTLNGTSPETTDGVYQFVADMSNMAAGDTVIFRVKEKVRSADTQALVFAATYSDSQAEPVWMSPPLTLLHGWDFTLAQTAGTGRVFTWSIRKIV